MKLIRYCKRKNLKNMMLMLWRHIWKSNNKIKYHSLSRKYKHMRIVKVRVMMRILNLCPKVKQHWHQACSKVQKIIQIRPRALLLQTQQKPLNISLNKFLNIKVLLSNIRKRRINSFKQKRLSMILWHLSNKLVLTKNGHCSRI